MKVLHVIQHSMPFGVTQACYGVSNQLGKEGHQVTILTTDRGLNQYAAPTAANNVDVIPFHCVASVSNYLISPSIKRWLRNNVQDFDVIHMHNFRTYQNANVHHYARVHNIPYLLQAHGSVLPIFEKRIQKKAFDLFWGKSILKEAAKVIALTTSEVAQYRNMGVAPERIEIVPNGIDLFEYTNLPKRGEFKDAHAFAENERIVLFLGRLHKVKGVDFLVETFSRLLLKMDNARLVIAGPDSGALAALQGQTVSLKIEESVSFTGPLFGQDKLSAYVDADVFVLPSVYDTFPVAVLEACACGTPIIVSDECGIADLVKGFGCVVERDADVLCDVMYRVLNNDTTRTDLGKKGRQFVARELSWDKITKRIEEIYRNVTAKDSCTGG